jgi:hypothetical protein
MHFTIDRFCAEPTLVQRVVAPALAPLSFLDFLPKVSPEWLTDRQPKVIVHSGYASRVISKL